MTELDILFDQSLWGLLPLAGGFFKKALGFATAPAKMTFNTLGGVVGGFSDSMIGPGYQTQPIDIDPSMFQMGQTSDGQMFADAMAANQNLRGMFERQAAGQGPSVAQGLLRQGTEQGMQGQLALASGSRNPLAARQAAQNMAGLQQGAAGQAAIVGAQEQLQAQQALMQLQNQQEEMARFFESLGFSRDQAQLQAQQQLAGLQAGTNLGLQEIQAGQAGNRQRGRASILSGLGQAGAMVAMGGPTPTGA